MKPTIQRKANRMSQLNAIQIPTITARTNKRLMKQPVIKSRLKSMKKLKLATKKKRRRRSNP